MEVEPEVLQAAGVLGRWVALRQKHDFPPTCRLVVSVEGVRTLILVSSDPMAIERLEKAYGTLRDEPTAIVSRLIDKETPN